MKWINAIALIFQFAAFWFVAPELLGVSALKRFEKSLKKLIALLPILVIGGIILGYGLTFSIMGIYKGIKSQTEGVSSTEMNNYFIVMGLSTVVYFTLMIFYKKLKRFLENRVAIPLTKNLIENNEMRSTSLVIGAVLFTFGFLLQLFIVLY